MLSHSQQQKLIRQLNRSELKSMFTNMEFSDNSSSLPAVDDVLSGLPARAAGFARHWLVIIQRNDRELAQVFLRRIPQALQLMDFDDCESWILDALAQFDQRGLGWALTALDEVDSFAEKCRSRENILALDSIGQRLEHFVLGLGGRKLKIAAHKTPYTDTETIFLPAHLQLGREQSNFQLYKAMAAHHWAQTWFGTWRDDVLAQLVKATAYEGFIPAYAALERLRLDACIAREYPGIYRLMQKLDKPAATAVGLAPAWQQAAIELGLPDASALDSCRWAERLRGAPAPSAACYHGSWYVDRVQRVMSARLAREKNRLHQLLARLHEDLRRKSEGDSERPLTPRTRKPTEGFSLAQQAQDSVSGVRLQLKFDERPITMSTDMQQLVNSIIQDLGEVPEEYFRPGGDKPYDADAEPGENPSGTTVSIKYYEKGTLLYPEWDYERQHFRPDYCMLREHTVKPGDDEFIPQTLRKYQGTLKSIRRTFEAMLGEIRLERRQVDGDDIDLDALVSAQADVRNGEELSESVYTRLRNTERNIAVMFMVDMSGSTKGWVNDAEREALVLLCEALTTIGDRYAIYGFSGRTHRRVDIYHVKRFDEAYSQEVRRRISGIQPRAYTRMGAAIRHLGNRLNQVPARNKLLITLSDGKPEDYGSYYGKYGIEDTRHALLEIRRSGIHPFCITIDREGSDYLPYMYGAANFACIDDVRSLPLKVADIYRRLTT